MVADIECFKTFTLKWSYTSALLQNPNNEPSNYTWSCKTPSMFTGLSTVNVNNIFTLKEVVIFKTNLGVLFPVL
jgi:hypothetical protein